MKFGKRTYIPLTELAEVIGTRLRTLCDWLHDHKFDFFARSDIDDEKFHRLRPGCYKTLLAYTEKEAVALFYYPKEFDIFLKHSTYHQRLRRKHLYMTSVEAETVISEMQKEIGHVRANSYGVSLLRKPAHQTKPTWKKNHDKFISEANKLLKADPLAYTKVGKSGRTPHIAKLAEALESAQKSGSAKDRSNLGWTFRTIQEVLGKRKSELVVPDKI